MKDKEIIQKLIDQYESALKAITGHIVDKSVDWNINYYDVVNDFHVQEGVCLCAKHLSLEVTNKYWITKNIPKNKVFWCTAGSLGANYLAYRLYILKRELTLINRYGYLARWIRI